MIIRPMNEAQEIIRETIGQLLCLNRTAVFGVGMFVFIAVSTGVFDI